MVADSWNFLTRALTWVYGENTYRASRISAGQGLTITRTDSQTVELNLADPLTDFGVWDPAPAMLGREVAATRTITMATAGDSFGVEVATASTFRWAISIPFGYRLKTVRVLLDPATHASMPAVKPILTLYSVALSAGAWTQTQLAQVTEPLTDPTDYSAAHYLSLTGLTVDNVADNALSSDPADQTQYELELDGEDSTNAANLPVLGALYVFEAL